MNCLYDPQVDGPCNGVLCLHYDEWIALWNSSTGEFKTLSQSSVQHSPNLDYSSFVIALVLGDFDEFVLAFDMVDKKFSTLPMPEFGVFLTQYNYELLDFNGLLGAIVYPIEVNGSTVNVGINPSKVVITRLWLDKDRKSLLDCKAKELAAAEDIMQSVD
ncbi:60S ribosomal protein L26-1 [Hibiscus syriacus]|uniref:60S ribosomal protein L26-1 n=1 Tax=Hibiscus syriacus TaxID=106335 RepID=A0A6A2YDP8_HIBSY|nr:60S ribosomal protein L26-1 [Hibiscus syriacus]